MTTAITPPDGWNVLIDELSTTGVYTLRHNQQNVKIHCNKVDNEYQVVMVHPIDGPTAETTAKQEELDTAISRVASKLN